MADYVTPVAAQPQQQQGLDVRLVHSASVGMGVGDISRAPNQQAQGLDVRLVHSESVGGAGDYVMGDYVTPVQTPRVTQQQQQSFDVRLVHSEGVGSAGASRGYVGQGQPPPLAADAQGLGVRQVHSESVASMRAQQVWGI